MRRWWIPVLTLLAVLSSTAAGAAGKGTVAILPALVVNGNAENSTAVTSALRASLEKHGFTVTPDDKVQAAMKSQKVDTARVQTLSTLGKLRTATGAEYVVYPRVLSVGFGLNGLNPQAVIIVNVAGSSTKSLFWTRQVSQRFTAPEGATKANLVIPDEGANEAAGKLLEGFYAKVK